jgi:hypothetical protein
MNNPTPYSEILQKGDYTRIAKLLPKKRAVRTVEAQLKGGRTLKDDVKAAADIYISWFYPDELKEHQQSQPA